MGIASSILGNNCRIDYNIESVPQYCETLDVVDYNKRGLMLNNVQIMSSNQPIPNP